MAIKTHLACSSPIDLQVFLWRFTLQQKVRKIEMIKYFSSKNSVKNYDIKSTDKLVSDCNSKIKIVKYPWIHPDLQNDSNDLNEVWWVNFTSSMKSHFYRILPKSNLIWSPFKVDPCMVAITIQKKSCTIFSASDLSAINWEA
jgi:hypothetical protein